MLALNACMQQKFNDYFSKYLNNISIYHDFSKYEI